MIGFDDLCEKVCTGTNGLSAVHIINRLNINFHSVETNENLTLFVPIDDGMAEIKISKKENRVLYLEANQIKDREDC